jgi:hypothetical protein
MEGGEVVVAFGHHQRGKEDLPASTNTARETHAGCLEQIFPWSPALAIVQSRIFVGWHRAGFRLFWRWKSRPVARPRLPKNLQTLILTMARIRVGVKDELPMSCC